MSASCACRNEWKHARFWLWHTVKHAARIPAIRIVGHHDLNLKRNNSTGNMVAQEPNTLFLDSKQEKSPKRDEVSSPTPPIQSQQQSTLCCQLPPTELGQWQWSQVNFPCRHKKKCAEKDSSPTCLWCLCVTGSKETAWQHARACCTYQTS